MTTSETPAPELWPDIFGACPACGSVDERLNVERCHWFVCHEHKTKWFFGSKVFGSWLRETPETWMHNASLMETYTEVTPIHGCDTYERFDSHPHRLEGLPRIARDIFLSRGRYDCEVLQIFEVVARRKRMARDRWSADWEKPFEERYGSCPSCGDGGFYVNIGPEHWIVCRQCKMKWLGGYDTLASWCNETADLWIKNQELLSHYRDVTPFRSKERGRLGGGVSRPERPAGGHGPGSPVRPAGG
jgi:hypothetical protein